ncbi:MAG: glycosyltransferase family 2 protein [Cyclobacteriaceae bacterium]
MSQFSTVTTCFNEEDIITKAVKSISNQTAYDLIDKIYVVDDGSKDNSRTVIEDLAKKEPKIRYVYQDNAGLPSARNTALKLIDSEYIAFLDGDDYWHPKKIEIFFKEIKLNPGAGIYYSNYMKVIKGREELVQPIKYHVNDTNQLDKFLANGGPIVPSTVVITQECLNEVGYFNKEFLNAEDTEYWLRTCAKLPLHYIDYPLTYKVSLTDSLGSNRPEKVMYIQRAMDDLVQDRPELEKSKKLREFKLQKSVFMYYLGKRKYKEAVLMIKFLYQLRPKEKSFISYLSNFIKRVARRYVHKGIII